MNVVINQLFHFDAPTEFAAGVNSASASLNNRKECLVLSDRGNDTFRQATPPAEIIERSVR